VRDSNSSQMERDSERWKPSKTVTTVSQRSQVK